MFHVMHTRLEEPFKVPPLHCNDVNVNKYCFVCNAEGKWVVVTQCLLGGHPGLKLKKELNYTFFANAGRKGV